MMMMKTVMTKDDRLEHYFVLNLLNPQKDLALIEETWSCL